MVPVVSPEENTVDFQPRKTCLYRCTNAVFDPGQFSATSESCERLGICGVKAYVDSVQSRRFQRRGVLFQQNSVSRETEFCLRQGFGELAYQRGEPLSKERLTSCYPNFAQPQRLGDEHNLVKEFMV
jgi:hypothetical protein